MGLRDLFRRKSLPARSFDEVRVMVTRELPLPGLDESKFYMRLRAVRNSNNTWSIYRNTKEPQNFSEISTEGKIKMPFKAVVRAIARHASKDHPGQLSVSFDVAFLILKEVEESHLKYIRALPGEEPPFHYMAAFRLLPQPFREGLNDLYQARMKIVPKFSTGSKKP